MTYLQAIILGILQGLAEFLPISSSGHLVLLPSLLGWEFPPDQAFAFNVMLQAATLIAVFSFFFNDLLLLVKAGFNAIRNKSFSDPQAMLGIYIIIATIPAGMMGMLFNGFFERLYNSPQATAMLLVGTALLLIAGEKAGKRSRSLQEINWIDALWVGVFQILALLPGISRSGTTITGGLLRDFERTTSARFSFLISVPLLFAAGLSGFYKFILLPNTTSSLPIFLVGSLTAAITGYIAIKWLLNFLKDRSFYIFVVYCLIFAAINLLIIAVRTP
jgi:undecaprenyl-diphosphatase